MSEGTQFDVEEAAFGMIRFEGGLTLELAVSWVLNQSPAQNGVVCRVHGDQGAVEVYSAKGAVLHRGFTHNGESKETPLKLPKTTGHGTAVWVGEGVAITGTDAAFGQITLSSYKAAYLEKISIELLTDNAVDLESYLPW